jgi:hypothetical protein
MMNWKQDERHEKEKMQKLILNQYKKLEITPSRRNRMMRCVLREWLDDPSSLPRRRSRNTFRST